MLNIRPMNYSDLDAVMKIQSMAYIPQYCESREVYEDKFAKYPDGCWVAEIDDYVVGYVISHPYLLDSPPKLDAVMDDIPQNPDCYFIHDVAINPEYKGKGIGSALCEKAKSLAKERNLPNMALISVQDSHPFWEKMGFRRVENLTASMTEKLESYITDEFPDPKFMVLILR